jgi:toxin ParE1/3/4
VAYEVEWAASALDHLVEQLEFIARDSPSYAAALSVKAERAAGTLSDLPHRGRLVPEYRDPDVREIPVGSYRLIYRIGESTIVIVAFVHTRRDLASLLAE